ncbi:OB-fold domain-containing protein [uncultured Williamsia sp.]|uniref:thiolase C-terminal domain-containing protein n=1 Tax=uncultured Williamsia sp. TaxID=259311 RepID=UPI002611D911|nr:OB-fold domain-containing protein [uncultured Williamsia sp.]
MTTTSIRPAPQTTILTRDFWASGADGVLRISRCDDCGAWNNPTPAACRRCRSRSLTMTPTSGRGTVVGVSVNHQHLVPSMPPPYVVAIVAIDEDDGARLTTNVVGCDVDDVVVGMRVRVRFEQASEHVWLPLFEPDPEAGGETGPVPEPDPASRRVRPPVSRRKFEDDVAITGVGQSRVGRRLMIDPVTLAVDAAERAVADAGLTMDDIDGLSTYPGWGPTGISEGGIMPLEQSLTIHPTWVNGGGDLPGQNGSIITAMLAVSAGLCRHVLCIRSVWQSTNSAMMRAGEIDPPSGRPEGMMESRGPYGAMSPATWIGCQASNYMHRYGVGREVLGAIAVTTRAHAGANPEAVYRDPLTMDEYMSARMVSTPFGLYDCDVPCDGAVAVVVSAIDAVADMDCEPVFVEAVGTQITEPLSWDQGTLHYLPQTIGPAAHLWSRTDLGPDDVDVGCIYDGFTFNALSWIETLGFCGAGEAADLIGDGSGIAVDGTLPLNPHGGQLSAGRLHGYGFVREAVLQLRGRGSGLQVPDARVAVATAGGGVPSGAILFRREG